MAARSISETERVRYLLGLSSPAEREHIESEYFENEEAFQAMLTAEDDLIDTYARGELTSDERRRFEMGFVRSLRGRDRVQFARAFARAVPAIRLVETKLPATLLDIFKTFQSPGLFRTVTIATVIVFVAVLSWLVNDRRRMSNELRELRAESAELSKRIEALQRSSDTERTRTALLPELPAPDKSRHRERRTTASRQARHLPEVKNDPEKIASSKPEQAEKPINNPDASFGNSLIPRNVSSSGGTTVRGTVKDAQGNVVSSAMVTLTDRARNSTRTQHTNEDGAYVFNAVPAGTYSLEVSARGFKTVSVLGLAALVDTPTVGNVQLEVGPASETIAVTAAAEATINRDDATLGNSFERKRITELPLNANNVVGLLSLQPRVSRPGFVNVMLHGVDATMRIPSSLRWIRFQIALKTAAIHEDYRITIKTADDRRVTSVDWSEPLTPNQTIIDTPAISTSDLPSGDYVLLLMGKEPDGSFVKVAEYSFKVIKY